MDLDYCIVGTLRWTTASIAGVEITKEDGSMSITIWTYAALAVGIILGLAIEHQWGWMRKIRNR